MQLRLCMQTVCISCEAVYVCGVTAALQAEVAGATSGQLLSTAVSSQ